MGHAMCLSNFYVRKSIIHGSLKQSTCLARPKMDQQYYTWPIHLKRSNLRSHNGIVHGVWRLVWQKSFEFSANQHPSSKSLRMNVYWPTNKIINSSTSFTTDTLFSTYFTDIISLSAENKTIWLPTATFQSRLDTLFSTYLSTSSRCQL